MSSEVQLRPADIIGQLRHISRRWEHPRPVALYGTGQRCQVEVDGARWDVLPVRCELELRAALIDTEHDNAVAFLMDYDDRLPLDVACRLAGQKVYPVDRRARLANLFGARKVAPGMVATALAEVLLDELPDLPPIAGTLLQPDDAWRRYLSLHLGLLLEEPSVTGLLRAGLARAETGQRFARRRDDPAWARLLDEASVWFEHKLGLAGVVVWQAWLGGHAAKLVAWLVHIDAARRASDKTATLVLRQALRYAQGVDEAWLSDPLVVPLCQALEALLKSLQPTELRLVLAQAGQVFDDADFAIARRASPWLAEGFDALQEDLALGLSRVLDDPSALSSLHKIFGDLAEHRLASVDAGAGAVRAQQVRTAAVRLVTWLAWLERKPLPDEPGWACMSALATWYNAEGGWVDWAREELRTQTTNHAGLDDALRPVLARADKIRRDADRRFAHATLDWVAAGKPSSDVLPIERVTRDVVAGFLGHPNRKLLVVLLDGMSMSVATRLVEAQDGWATVNWSPKKHKTMPPAMASLPSLTATSRAAFFAGKHEARFGEEPEAQDPKRFAANAALATLGGTSAGPRLFLKPHLGSANELAQPVVDALRDEAERVVAVVVNAIDDQLKGSDQVMLPYEQPHSIPLLERLLRVAHETERAVLLVSDHGHIPSQVMKGNKPPEATQKNGHRWRTLGPGQHTQEGEVELPDTCWKPRGATRVAVFWDERRAWGNARFGAHGGLTLAEAVIPVRLLAPDWLVGVVQPPDEQLRTREQEPPAWWRLAAPPTSRRRRVPVPAPQPTLFPTKAPRVAEVVPDEVVVEQPSLVLALRASATFRAKAEGQPDELREMALRFVGALLKAPGYAMSREAFARVVGIKTRRLTSRVAQIGFLNADGFTVIEDDSVGNQVRLRLDRLTAQYGLDA